MMKNNRTVYKTNQNSNRVQLKATKTTVLKTLKVSKQYELLDFLFEKISNNVNNIAVFGETKQKIILSAKKYNFKNIYEFNDLKSCILASFHLASPNSVVLLSPACASFDQFSSYVERGNVFKKIVKEIAFDENLHLENKKTT